MKTNRLLFFLILSFPLWSFAQTAGRTEGLPISVKIKTSVNIPGGAAEISGVSNTLDKDPGQVFLEIGTPDGTTEKLSARADKTTGEYNIKYTCKGIGKYSVTAFASDRKQSAQTEFTVALMTSVTAQFKSFEKQKERAVIAVDAAIVSAAAAGGGQGDAAKAKAKVAEMKATVQQFDQNFAELKTAVDNLTKLANNHPGMNALIAPDLGKIASELDEKSDFLKQMEKQLGDSKNESDICQRYYQVSEGCALFSTVMNGAAGGLKAIAKSVFIDKVWPKIEEKFSPKSFNSTDNFFWTQAGKAGLTATGGFEELFTKGFKAGASGDLVQFVSNELFKKNCTEFKGPVSGTYEVISRNEGKEYMRYKLTYNGIMSLYAKNSTIKNGSTPKLSGYFEGNVTQMDFSDNIWAVEEKKDWDEIKYQRVAAPVAPFTAAESDPGFGAVARGTLPGSFYFPLQGQMAEGKMIIKFLPALSDFTEAFQNRSVVVVKAKEKPFNTTGAVFSYPIQNATFIITRTMRTTAGTQVVSLPVKSSPGTGTLIEQQFNREEAPSEDTNVKFAMSLRMENKP